jgi:hypothetical protein
VNKLLRSFFDYIGVSISAICAVHCLALPVLAISAPYLIGGLIASEALEWGILLTSATLGITSVVAGHLKHRSYAPVRYLSVALFALFVGVIMHDTNPIAHAIFMVLGGSLMAATHWANLKLCRACPDCHRE